jgi:hypothetical protein
MDINDRLKNNETSLVGSWITNQDKIIQDKVCKRIDWLVTNCLKKLAVDKSGWETLYQDLNDKRYWVLSYPNSDWHGGGPPALKTISQVDAQAKFKID